MKPLLKRVSTALGLSVAAVGSLGTACTVSQTETEAPTHLSYIVVPHPDDEWQAWSLFEATPQEYKVFLVMTRGEQTARCSSPGYDEGTGEASPSPWPDGRWTASCEAARQNSFFEFLQEMASADQGMPATYTYEGVKGPFDSLGYTVCRHDDGGCIPDRTAEVWTSPTAAVVWFNLGDGDLTASEVEWAITTARDNRSELGIDASLPPVRLIGASYWNSTHPGCFVYEHDDHRAAHDALWNVDFGVGEQLAATCAADPAAARNLQVSAALVEHAFETSGPTRIGAHVVNYGWLGSGDPVHWAGDPSGQNELFHRHQTFWVRFGAS